MTLAGVLIVLFFVFLGDISGMILRGVFEIFDDFPALTIYVITVTCCFLFGSSLLGWLIIVAGLIYVFRPRKEILEEIKKSE